LNSQFEARIDSAGLENLIAQSQAAVASLKQQLEQGKDLLLELASFDPDAGQAITEGLEIAEATDALEQYLTASFDYFGLSAEPLTSTINLVKPTPELQSHNLTSEDSARYLRYPELPEVGLSYTYDRATALRREDIQFLSWEHPLVTQAFDRVLSDQTGNAAITLINRAELSAGTLLVEAIFRIDCTAPVWLGLQQHVQKPLLRFVIGPDRKEFSKVFPSQSLDDALPAKTEPLARLIGLQRAVIESMLDEAHQLATIEVTRIRASAQESYQAKTQKQLQRLKDLSRRNPNISKAMVAQVLKEQNQGNASLEQLAPRLDAIRVIIGV
jgi:ATP-dependent helicase HepA